LVAVGRFPPPVWKFLFDFHPTPPPIPAAADPRAAIRDPWKFPFNFHPSPATRAPRSAIRVRRF